MPVLPSAPCHRRRCRGQTLGGVRRTCRCAGKLSACCRDGSAAPVGVAGRGLTSLPHNRLSSGCTGRGKGGPQAHPAGTRSALPAVGAVGQAPPEGSGCHPVSTPSGVTAGGRRRGSSASRRGIRGRLAGLLRPDGTGPLRHEEAARRGGSHPTSTPAKQTRSGAAAVIHRSSQPGGAAAALPPRQQSRV